MSTNAIPKLQLNDGNEMPKVAYGLGSVNINAGDDQVVKAVTQAISLGYHHLDCAEAYGNEEGVGKALKETSVARDQLFITGKVLGLPGQDIKASLDASLQKMGIEYFDLYLIHLPFLAPDELPAMWGQMEELKRAGKAKSIGVSNFLQTHLESILKTATIIPVINQLEYHPNLQHGDLVGFCRSKNIAVSAYSALIAVTKPIDDQLRAEYETLAKKYGVTSGDVALRWCLDQDIAVVTTSLSEKRLRDYLATLFSFKLEAADVARISEIGNKTHYRVLYTDRYGPDDRS